jgi:putative tricarboxylic transport membrane protein
MFLSIWLAIAVFFLTTPACAQAYPTRTITIIVPFAAGGPGDVIGRLIAKSMSTVLGQQIIIENLGGAGGTIGANRAAKAASDGHTLLLAHVGLATSVTLYRNPPYDPVKDFEPIGMVTDVTMTLVARRDFPPKDLKEAERGEDVSFGNAGIGSASHLCGLLFMSAIDTAMNTIQYKGGGPAVNDLLAGHIDFYCDPATGTTSHIRAGKIKVYAVTTKKRLATLPDVPTADEAGLPGFEVSTWYGLYAPRATQQPIIEKLVTALQHALKDPDVINRFATLSMEPVPLDQATPQALQTYLKAEVEKWAPIIRKAGVYAD